MSELFYKLVYNQLKVQYLGKGFFTWRGHATYNINVKDEMAMVTKNVITLTVQ